MGQIPPALGGREEAIRDTLRNLSGFRLGAGCSGAVELRTDEVGDTARLPKRASSSPERAARKETGGVMKL